MSGGWLIETALSPLQSPEPSPEPDRCFFITPAFAMSPVQVPAAIPSAKLFHVVHHHHHQAPQHQGAGGALPHHLLAPIEPAKPSAGTVRALRLSGWYYEGIAYQDSQDLLKDKALGTFLVRDSSDRRFLYSLSVQTERGPTSVRIHYSNGLFRLDAQQHIQSMMPAFPSVIELVEHYVEHSHRSTNSPHVWVDPRGKMYSPITITRPLVKEGQKPASLKHSARLAINAALGKSRLTSIGQLELPTIVSQYLIEYPYSI